MSYEPTPGRTGSKFLDSLVGEDGFKTDLDIHFPPEELWKAGSTLFITGACITLFVFAVRGVINTLNP